MEKVPGNSKKLEGLFIGWVLVAKKQSNTPGGKMATGVMSSEDFRAHLYHSLQGKGIVNSLKVNS